MEEKKKKERVGDKWETKEKKKKLKEGKYISHIEMSTEGKYISAPREGREGREGEEERKREGRGKKERKERKRERLVWSKREFGKFYSKSSSNPKFGEIPTLFYFVFSLIDEFIS
ncbi:hypothetical protein [Enterobacter hormaechei]|uniref:hypothetical protein n=1 Tax=Enterobacter hormaechei TaxID=158836 RepID=UPI0023E3AA95|nr:hypothetical protein [Enterobacter hormaechei]MDF3578174.1 hypothetical protein [Enterobacter hormaechei]